MGHNRLPRLPASRTWQQVVSLLDAAASSEAIISQAAIASRDTFHSAIDDPVYVEAVRLLVVLAQVRRSEDMGPALRRQGLDLGQNDTLIDLLDAVSVHLDRTARSQTGNSDIGELARRALLATLHGRLLERMPGLFSEEPGDLANALRHFSGPGGFSELSRSFFTQLTSETLAYWLERSLSARIDDAARRDAFDVALDQFSAEATRIIKEFSSGWFAKHAFGVEATPDRATRDYAAIAFKKINDELSRKTAIDV